MDRDAWDARYQGDELVWRAEPNQFLVREVELLPAGRALDLACGEGRNAVWLATRGWQVTGVDFSERGLEKARRLAADRGADVEWVAADLLAWNPPQGVYDLVIVFYLQLAAPARGVVLSKAAAAVAAGGTLLVVGHDLANLTDGYGGPQDPAVLFTPDDVASELDGLRVDRAERVQRTVTTDAGDRVAVDALVRAVRPDG